jgi:hypothetical protein
MFHKFCPFICYYALFKSISYQDIKAEANAALNLRTVGDGSLFGVGVLGTLP